SPSILSVEPAVGNPVGDIVECGFIERRAVAELAFVGRDLIARPPEIDLQRFVDELPAFAGWIAGVIGGDRIGPAVSIRKPADLNRKEVDARIDIDPSRHTPHAAVDSTVAYRNGLLGNINAIEQHVPRRFALA